MKLVAAIDFETSTFLNKSKPLESRYNGHGIQIGLVLFNPANEKIYHSISALMSWDCIIHREAEAVHNISEENLREFGTNPLDIMTTAAKFIMNADAVIGHNIKFDIDHLIANLKRCGIKINKDVRLIDTMYSMKPVCKILQKNGKYKRPRLGEAYEYCFKETLKNGHDGITDAIASLNIWRWMERNRLPIVEEPYTISA